MDPREDSPPANDCYQLPWFAALDITLPISEKMVLMLLATLGIMAPAATATKPAINAYSIR
ncbi:MAG: hypothetical protein ABSB67_15150 [Bryobacteraceae bacterium]